MSNTTYEITSGSMARTESIATQLADWIAAGLLRVQWLATLARAPVPTVSESAAELLRLAEKYEATQPSYASDLRAAAGQAE